MRPGLVYYLERSPLTGELIPTTETDELGFYHLGDLYVQMHGQSIMTQDYKVKVYVGDQVKYDLLEPISEDIYALKFTGSEIGSEHNPTFRLGRYENFRKTSIRSLIELEPLYLDYLEEKYNYNIVGETILG